MEYQIKAASDNSITAVLGDVISLAVNYRVMMLKTDLTERPARGVMELIPAYASLMVVYDPVITSFERLSDDLTERIHQLAPSWEKITDKELMDRPRNVIEIPVCYGGSHGPDLELCAELEGTDAEEIIKRHSSHDYYVYMIGFSPGHAYTARFEEPFSFKRRNTARLNIPGGSIVVQANLSNLIPFDQPCGWNVIGATPLSICDFSRHDPFLVHAGDWVRYIPVSIDEFDRIKRL